VVKNGNDRNRGTAIDVLLVEDDDAIRDVVAEALVRGGYTVQVARHGREALELLDRLESPPMLIMLDMMMPVMSGWQLLSILHAHPLHHDIPVVAMTASGLHPLDVEPNEWLSKPLDYHRLLATVGRFAGHSSSQPAGA
jgi:two-component system response regulator CpxR